MTDRTGVLVIYRSINARIESVKYIRSMFAITLLCLYRANAATKKQIIALSHNTRVAGLSVCVLCAKKAVPVIIHRINHEKACGLFRHWKMPRIYHVYDMIATTMDNRAIISGFIYVLCVNTWRI